MTSEISKSYEPQEVEKRWYGAWLEAGCFAGRPQDGGEPYTIVIPPPNVTGVLTMGHVLNNTLQDILIRRARQQGRPALWIPGTDHAGIATQTRVERELRKSEKKTRHDLGREAFLGRVWQWREKHGGIILEQLRRLGASCDWERTHFTMDPAYSRAVLTAFVALFHRSDSSGRPFIHRGKRMVNWCPVSLTALSDEEVIMKPSKGSLYQVRYEVVERPGVFIEVATTRPETIPGDTALAVNPGDPRYEKLVGLHVWRPLCRAQIPVIADHAVDREFGSGALKITPAHDKADFEIGLRHNLPVIDVLDPHAVLNDLAGPGLAGLDRFAGRKKAVEMLRDSGALVGEKPYENNVGYSERADVPVEPRLTSQWWLRYPRVDEAKEAVRGGHIRFHPERWSKVYLHWLENIQDWCISRQLWWGHRIPVWYRKGVDRDALTEEDLSNPARVHVSLGGPPDPENWVQEEDVLDTWASSWLWPFATMGWPDPAEMGKAGFNRFYPTATLVTGPDIIFFWVARMIMAGLEFTGSEAESFAAGASSAPAGRPAALDGAELRRRIPFRDVYFTGIIRDHLGRKMSKSLGNSPDPLDLIEKYGADGLRFGIISIAPQGQDIRFQEERIEGGRNFCNKLWNACRFRQMSGPAADNSSLEAILARIDPARLDADDHAIIERLAAATRAVDEAYASFEFSAAAQALYGFFWNDFCDWYVEVSKARLQDPASAPVCLAVQDLVLRQLLLLLHPFTPFITEELWQRLGYGAEGGFIGQAAVSGADALSAALSARGIVLDEEELRRVAAFKEFVACVRQLKVSAGMAAKRDSEIFLQTGGIKAAVAFSIDDLVKYGRLAGVASFKQGEKAPGENLPAVVTPLGTACLIVAASADREGDIQRMKKELEKLAQHIASTEARLANPAFTGKAPPAVIEGARRQLADLKAKQAETTRLLAAMG